MPPYNHEVGAKKEKAIGNLVLIPSSKYPACVAADAGGRDDFIGWAGKIIAYESTRAARSSR